MRRRLLVFVLLTAACTAGNDASSSTNPPTTDSSTATDSPTAADSPATTLSAGTTTDPPATEPTPGEPSLTVTGDPLPPAQQRHQEGEPVVGTIAPTLTLDDLVVPSERPTLLVTVVGSCADCANATQNLQPLVDEFDAVAVLLTSDAPATDLNLDWHVIIDEAAARAFAGRDRPTALVIGPTGTVLSRIRPFNQSGATYDEDDLRFALQIASNQGAGREPGRPTEPIIGPRLDPDLPTSFFAVTDQGATAVEVSTADGSVIRRLARLPAETSDEIEAQVIDEVIPIPGVDLVLVNECCEPAGGVMRVVPIGGDYAAARDRASFDGWEVDLSNDGLTLVFSGYFRRLSMWDPAQVAESGALPSSIWEQDVQLGGSNGSTPDVAWLRDRAGVVYLHRGNEFGVVEIIELGADRQPISRRSFELGSPGQAVAVNADGDIVVASSAYGSDATIGQVYDIDGGELLAEFELADGTRRIDYDTLGRYLISVGNDGVVRWQGAGGSGELGQGFTSANW